MMKITLKDGSVKEYENQMAVIDIAKDISEGLARMACAGEIDGETVDLRTIVCQDCRLDILTAKDENGLAALRHTASRKAPVPGYQTGNRTVDCRRLLLRRRSGHAFDGGGFAED